MKTEKDLTAVVATLVAIIEAYVQVSSKGEDVPGAVISGFISSPNTVLEGREETIYAPLMNKCMVFIANYGNDAVTHKDLYAHLVRIAFHKYREIYGQPSGLQKLTFSEKAVNDVFKDTKIVFVPAHIDYPLITYKTSVPIHSVQGEERLQYMIDKLQYCHVA